MFDCAYPKRTQAEWDTPRALKCRWCKYVQANRKRKVDLERHEKTHFRDEPYTCVGLPPNYVTQTDDYARARWAYCDSREFVGGCGKILNRRDTYIRHLGKSSKGCKGDAYGLWHPSNAKYRWTRV